MSTKSKKKKKQNEHEFVVDGKFPTRSGELLPLKVVKTQVIRTLTSRMGALDLFAADLDVEDAMASLNPSQQMEAMAAWESLCNYCLGFGVEIEVPEDARTEMEVLGLWDGNEHLRQANYLQLTVLDDEEEVGNLVGSVIWITKQADIEKREKQKARDNQPSRKKRK